MICLVSSLPDPIVLQPSPIPHPLSPLPPPTHCDTIGSLHIEHKVLDKGHFIESEDDLESSSNHLSQSEEVERGGVHLQMTPVIITHHCCTCTCTYSATKNQFSNKNLCELFLAKVNNLSEHCYSSNSQKERKIKEKIVR